MARGGLTKRSREVSADDEANKENVAPEDVTQEPEAAVISENSESASNNCDEPENKKKRSHYKPETLELQKIAAQAYEVASEEERKRLFVVGSVREQQNAKHSKNRNEKRKSKEHRAKKDMRRALKQREEAEAKIAELEDEYGLTVIQKQVIVSRDEIDDYEFDEEGSSGNIEEDSP